MMPNFDELHKVYMAILSKNKQKILVFGKQSVTFFYGGQF